MKPTSLVSVLALVFALGGCGGTTTAKTPGPRTGPGHTDGRDGPPTSALPGPAAVPSVVIAEIHRDDIDWAFARHGDDGLLLIRKDGRFLTGPVRVDRGDEAVPENSEGLRDIGPAPKTATPTVLRGVKDGFILMWTETSGSGSSVRMVSLTVDGKPKGEIGLVATTKDPVIWVDVLHSASGGSWLLWETENTDGATVRLKGFPEGDEVVAATNVRGWHAVPSPRGAVMAFVQGDAGRAVSVGAEGLSPVVELGAVGARGDVVVAGLEDRFVVAWTAVDGDDSHVEAAAVGYDGKILRPAAPAVAPIAPTQLHELVASSDGKSFMLAYERRLGTAPRQFVLETMSPNLERIARANVEYHSAQGGPHVVADGTGYTVLTSAPMREKDEQAAAAPETMVPVFVRLDRVLAPRGSEPIRLEPLAFEGARDGVPALVSGMHCEGDLCTVLAEGDQRPTLVVLAELPERTTTWAVPLAVEKARGGPQLKAMSKTADVPARVAALSSTKLADGRTALAWITHGDTGGTTPTSRVAVQIVAADGTPGEVETISERGIAVGGVKIVATGGSKGTVAHLVWSGPSSDVAQVYLTAIDEKGRKGQQKTLTRLRKGKDAAPLVLDVDAVAEGNGVIVAWSDTSHGNQEVFVARANAQLTRRGKPVRITETKGLSGEPRLQAMGDQLLLAWTDTLDGDQPDVFVQALTTKSLAPSGDRTRIDDAPTIARSPRWSGDAANLALSWIDEPAAETGGAARARWVTLDASGKPATPRDISLAGAALSSLVLRCGSDTCKGLAIGKQDTTLALGPFVVSRIGTNATVVTPHAHLPRGSAQDVALEAPDDEHFYFFRDRAGGAEGLIRRLVVSW